MNKKADGLPLNMIIIAIIAIVVLVVIIAIFTGNFAGFMNKLKGAGDPSLTCSAQSDTTKEMECALEPLPTGDDVRCKENNGWEITSRESSSGGQICCCHSTK
jgi:hypothetical protein